MGQETSLQIEKIMVRFKKQSQEEVIILNCTQCHKGGISKDYATSRSLYESGVVPGADMTIETAICKLMYLLSQKDVSKNEWKIDVCKSERWNYHFTERHCSKW